MGQHFRNSRPLLGIHAVPTQVIQQRQRMCFAAASRRLNAQHRMPPAGKEQGVFAAADIGQAARAYAALFDRDDDEHREHG